MISVGANLKKCEQNMQGLLNCIMENLKIIVKTMCYGITSKKSHILASFVALVINFDDAQEEVKSIS